MEQYPSATTAYFQAYNLNRENAGLAVALVNSLYRMGASSPDYISEGIAICDTALFYNPGNRQSHGIRQYYPHSELAISHRHQLLSHTPPIGNTDVRLAIAILEWNNILLLRPLIFRRIT